MRGAVQFASESKTELATLGFFGQQQAAWRERLFLTGAVRWDASSTFGDDERWQFYPKASVSYVLSEEPFFRNSGMGGAVNELRLRAALGYAGNQPPLNAAYARESRFGSAVNIDRLGLIPLAQAGNPNLAPERQREVELGARPVPVGRPHRPERHLVREVHPRPAASPPVRAQRRRGDACSTTWAS